MMGGRGGMFGTPIRQHGYNGGVDPYAETDPSASGWAYHAPTPGTQERDQPANARERAAQSASDALQGTIDQEADPQAHEYTMQALGTIGKRAFGGPEKGYAQAQEAAITSPYQMERGPMGPSPASSMVQGMSTLGNQAMMGAARGEQGFEQAQQNRLGALSDYGGMAGAARQSSDQLAQFNANQHGQMTSTLWDMLYGGAQQQQQRDDQKTAQDWQTGIGLGTSLLKLIPGL